MAEGMVGSVGKEVAKTTVKAGVDAATSAATGAAKAAVTEGAKTAANAGVDTLKAGGSEVLKSTTNAAAENIGGLRPVVIKFGEVSTTTQELRVQAETDSLKILESFAKPDVTVETSDKGKTSDVSEPQDGTSIASGSEPQTKLTEQVTDKTPDKHDPQPVQPGPVAGRPDDGHVVADAKAKASENKTTTTAQPDKTPEPTAATDTKTEPARDANEQRIDDLTAQKLQELKNEKPGDKAHADLVDKAAQKIREEIAARESATSQVNETTDKKTEGEQANEMQKNRDKLVAELAKLNPNLDIHSKEMQDFLNMAQENPNNMQTMLKAMEQAAGPQAQKLAESMGVSLKDMGEVNLKGLVGMVEKQLADLKQAMGEQPTDEQKQEENKKKDTLKLILALLVAIGASPAIIAMYASANAGKR